MSEVDVRPGPSSRGRSSARGSRGGANRAGQRANGTQKEVQPSLEEQGELGELQKKFAPEITTLKDMFPDWSELNLAFALQENDGDLTTTTNKMAEGLVNQFNQVQSSKDRSRSKAKEKATLTDAAPTTRGGRGRTTSEAIRGGRARGGRAGPRGGLAPSVATTDKSWDTAPISVPTTESSAWNTDAAQPTAKGSWDTGGAATQTTSSWDAKPDDSKDTTKDNSKKTWASMFAAKPKPAPSTPSAPVETPNTTATQNGQVTPAMDTPEQIPDSASAAAEAALTPPKDSLTEDNLEHVPDNSHPPATMTAASTVGSTAPPSVGRPQLGGYASSAYRAALPNRAPSFQRRVLDQQEAVVMPGHNAVDRTAVQFGSMGLNSGTGPDVDEERENPETRTQPMQSPPQAPRASLPPARAAQSEPRYGQDLQKQASQPGQLPSAAMALKQESQARYGQDSQQKPYDPFSDSSQQPEYSQSQPSHQGYPYSSGPSYSQYYTSEQQRNAYQNYYGGSYGQDAGVQRTSSILGAPEGLPGAQGQSARYNDTPGSTNAALAQPSSSPTQQGQPAPSHPMHQQHPGQGYNSSYPYGHPYYNSPYHMAYQNQFTYGQPYGNKYGQPQGYPSSYEHSSTAGSSQHPPPQSRDSALTTGLGEYGRTPSAQSSQPGPYAGSDAYRSQSGYASQSGYPQQAYNQTATSDELKASISPAMGQQPGRPSSTVNSSAPPAQGQQQQALGGYPGFNQSQYGIGGLGAGQQQQPQQAQQAQQPGYGAGYGGFGNTYGQGNAYGSQQQQQQQYPGRGGWNGTYGNH